MSLEEENRIAHALGQGEELLPQLMRHLILRAHDIKRPQPPQHLEELRRLAYLLTELPGAGIHSFDLRGCKTFSGLQGKFLLDALGRCGQSLEHL